MRLRVKFTKENYLKYISHLDLMRLFQRAFRRGNIPIKYSEGFNPQPKFSIANPLALGIESEEEYMDIDLEERISPKAFIEIMNKELPEGIRVLDARYVKDNRSITSLISWAYYQIYFEAKNINSGEELNKLVNNWLEMDKITIKRIRKKGRRVIEKEEDIKPLIGNIVIKEDKQGEENNNLKSVNIVMNCLLKAGDKGNLKPIDLLEAMEKYIQPGIDFDSMGIKRIGLFTERGGSIELPM